MVHVHVHVHEHKHVLIASPLRCICTYACPYTYTHAPYTRMHACIHVHMRKCTSTCECKCAFVCAFVHRRVHKHIPTRVHVHVHKGVRYHHAHTCTCARVFLHVGADRHTWILMHSSILMLNNVCIVLPEIAKREHQ